MASLPDLIADLATAFPRQPITADTLRLYMRELADLPTGIVEDVVRECMRTSEFFPTIRALREAAAERMLELPGEAAALSQIEARLRWARAPEDERGPMPPVHPLVVEALAHVGGFHGWKSTGEPGVTRGQFLRLYRELRAGGVREAQIGQPALPPSPQRKELDP